MSKQTYREAITAVFNSHWREGVASFKFVRDELAQVNQDRNLEIRNLGDIIYSFRYRQPLPEEIQDKAPADTEWVILPAGDAVYEFALAEQANIDPNPNLAPIKVPDSTPEMIRMYAESDEQATLARVRYNRLVDLFLSVTAYSVQNHLRTKLEGTGQIEIDELYVAVGTLGTHYVIPVQAKGGSDKVGLVQTFQDLAFCNQRFENLVPRALAVYSITGEVVAMMDLLISGGGSTPYRVQVRDERHYELVPHADLSVDELAAYRDALG